MSEMHDPVMGATTGAAGSNRTGIIRCSIAAALFGISAPLASRLTDDMGAFTLAGLLYLGAAVAVLPAVVRNPPSASAMRSSAANLAGAVVLGWSGSPEFRWGAVLIAGACLCWAFDNSITAALDHLAPAHITFVKGVIAGGVNITIGLLSTDAPALAPTWWALVIGAFGYGASITLWVTGARDLGAARGQLVFATAPFIGAIVAWVVLTDPVTVREVIAFTVGVLGVGFVLRSGHEHEHEHLAMEHEHEHEHDEHHRHHGDADPARHTHVHAHEPLVHSHPHVPDLHHRHTHG